MVYSQTIHENTSRHSGFFYTLESDRLYNDTLALIFQQSPNIAHHKVAERLEGCCNQIQFIDMNGEVFPRTPLYCRTRCCRRCQNTRAYRLVRDFKLWMPTVQEAKHLSFIYLSLGFRNVAANEIRKELINLNKGFSRLTSKKNTRWPGKGWTISRELTIADNELIHLNAHLIIAVSPTYFTTPSYLDHNQWLKECKEKFQIEYEPSLRIETVKDLIPGLDGLTRVFAYIVKPQEFISSVNTSCTLYDQLAGKRMLSFGGTFKKAKAQHYRQLQINRFKMRDKSSVES